MKQHKEEEHVVVITQGREDGGNAATFGFKYAVSIQMMNHPVSVFLTLGATRWSFRDTARDIRVPGEPCLEEYIQTFLQGGGDLMICSPCIAAYCYIPGIEIEEYEKTLRKNSRYVGLATVAEKLMHGSAMVF